MLGTSLKLTFWFISVMIQHLYFKKEYGSKGTEKTIQFETDFKLT